MARQMVKRLIIYTLLCIIHYTSNAQQYRWENITLDSSIVADKEMSAYISLYKDSLNIRMSDNLGVSKEFMDHIRPESKLSRLLADILLEMGQQWAKQNNSTQPLMSLINNGGIRSNLRKGPITRGEIYEIIPFENTMTFVTIDGKTLIETFEHIASRGGEGISNATLTIDNHKAINYTIDGEKVDSSKHYTIVTIDYIANGGDSFKMLQKGSSVDTGICFRSIIIEYLTNYKKTQKKLSAPIDRRITTIKHEN